MGRHGHRPDYLSGCTYCVQRSVTYSKRLRQRRYAQRVMINGQWISPITPQHGVKVAYVSYGCRCQQCSAAQRAANHRRYVRRKTREEQDVVVP